MQYHPEKLLVALGAAAMLSCQSARVVDYIPEPMNQTAYCQRTVGHRTMRLGESFEIRDEVSGELVDVIGFKLNEIKYAADGGNVNMTVTNLDFPDMNEQRSPNNFYLTGKTKKGGHIASYRVEFLRVDRDTLTLKFGPERCVGRIF